MSKLFNYLTLHLLTEILSLRKKRGSRFLFINKDDLLTLAKVYMFELLNQTKNADQELLKNVLKDLVSRNVLLPEPLIYSEYRIGGLMYYDIQLKTFDNQVYSRGTSTDKMEAYAKCLGEVFERFTLKHAANFNIKKIRIADPNVTGADSSILPYSDYPQPNDKQRQRFSFYQIGPDDEFECVLATDIKTGHKKWVSLQNFSLNTQYFNTQKLTVYSTTSGAGAGYARGQATNSAMLEILHRHFFLDSWFQYQKPEKIILEAGSQEFSNSGLYKKYLAFTESGFKVHWLNLSKSAGIPTVICILEKLGGWYMGGDAGGSLAKACERSLDEAFSIFLWSCRKNLGAQKVYTKAVLDSLESDYLDTRAVVGFKNQAFANSYFLCNFDRFYASGQERAVSLKELFQISNKKVEDILPGPVFVYEYETKLLQDYNYSVVKCFAPFTFNFALDEIYTLPIVQGQSLLKFTKINPFP